MRPMSDKEISAMRERVWDKIGPTLHVFAHFLATFIVVYLLCGFAGTPTHFSRGAYWLQFVMLLVPLAAYAYFGMFKKDAPHFR